ncbi:MAG TPA: hypothetical protein VNZ26_28195 [Vicinamibacterales bacterium]|jgi:hypothetical protein|nr:hypothetical protein [Vicinamibacterales bacterium]
MKKLYTVPTLATSGDVVRETQKPKMPVLENAQFRPTSLGDVGFHL